MIDQTPTAVKDGLTFFPIREFKDVDIVFSVVPEKDYFDRRNLPSVPRKYTDMVNQLFFSGGTLPEFAPGVDVNKAARWTEAMLGSFEPSHESKTATVAYAFWVWSTPEVVSNGVTEQ